MVDEGVSVRASRIENGGRDDLGRFVVGNPGGPGRPAKAHYDAVLGAMREYMTPKQTMEMYLDAYQTAKDSNSARGMMAVISDMLDRFGGKPVQHIVQESAGIVGIMHELGINIDE